jgi:PAS domain S-box-containing protein
MMKAPGLPQYSFAAIILISLFLLFPFKFVFPSDLSPDERRYLDDKAEIVFISQTCYPPFEFIGPPGEHTGICIELVRWMAAELGFQARFCDTSFKKAQEDVLAGRADVLTSLFFSDQRDKKFDFTQMLFQVPASIFVEAERPDIKDIHDLQGKRIAMQAGDYAQEFLEEKGIKFQIIYTENFAQATDLMIEGKADAIIGDEQIVLYHIYKNGLTGKVKQVGDPLYIGRNCLATREENDILISILNKGIRRAKTTGTLDKIQRKWLGNPILPPESRLVGYLIYIGFGAAILLLAVFLVWFWNLRLRRVVNRQTDNLRRSEARYRGIVNSFPDVYFETALNGEILEISQSINRISKYSRQELLGTDAKLTYVSPENRDKLIARLRVDSRIADFEVVLKSKDGQDVPCSLSAMLIESPRGEGQVIVGALRDISKRKEMEERLSYLSLAMECLGEMVIVTDLEHTITYCNTSVKDVLGYTQKEMIGHPAGEFFEGVPGNANNLREWIWTSADKKADIWRGELYNRKKDGGIIKVYLTLAWLRDISGEAIGTVGVSMDITEHRELENQLRHSQKLEAVGTLAGGIAHDFNNLLAGAIGYLSIITSEIPEDSPLLPDLAAIESLLWRGSDLTGSLLAFSSKGLYEPKPLDINRVVKEVLQVIERTAGKNIELKTNLSPECPSVLADPGQMHQIIMNLCLNACEVMPDGGRLSVDTVKAEPDDYFFRVHPELKRGSYVQISIADTGYGIKEIIRERIFEPFFSTKDDKTGVGLGLSVVSGIVERHGGSIKVESEVGKGSCFLVYFPAIEEKEQDSLSKPVMVLGAGETIMIVDDNPDFLEVMKIPLRKLGYIIITAQSGTEAVEILGAGDSKIDLVILDIIMKGLSGTETFYKLKELRADLPVILCTGFSHDTVAGDLMAAGARDFIQKPFNLEALTVKIRAIFS